MEKPTSNQKPKGWQKLGLLYSPDLKPIPAAKRLKRWVLLHKALVNELKRNEWTENQRILTPRQIEIIYKHLGEP